MKNKLLITIVFALITVGVFFKFNKNLEDIPIGCDEFGYLNLAKAFDEGTTYQNHVKRNYINNLLDTLRKNKISEAEIQWMVVPHAYYVINNTNQIINQYAPGTSYLLSFVSLPYRKQMFPTIAILLLLTLTYFTIYYKTKIDFSWSFLAVILVVFWGILDAPILTEFTRINSLAFTFGLLIAAGINLKNNPLLSVLFIAISANFRVVNLLLLLPVLLYIPFKKELSIKNLTEIIKTGIKYLLILFVGIFPYLIYVYKLRGNPFLPTYSVIDTTATFNIFSNLKFYFNLKDHWFQFYIIIFISMIILAYFKKISLKQFASISTFIIINYLFFVFHKVQINYYIYASSFIVLGYILSITNKIFISKNQQKVIKYLILLIASIIFIDGFVKYNSQTHLTFNESKSKIEVLCNYQIIWGDLQPSASEYVCKNNAFKFATTSPNARKIAINFLYNNGYNQLFLIDDIPLESNDIINEIKHLNIQFKTLNFKDFGRAIIINAKQND